MLVRGEGPATAKVVVIGEYPGTEEVARGKPFVGASGHLLKGMLRSAGFDTDQIYFTNVLDDGPPPRPAPNKDPSFTAFFRGKEVDPRLKQALARLKGEIAGLTGPNLIIACGGAALWATTGLSGIMKWAGSELRATGDFGSAKLIPTYNPAFILRSYAEKFAMEKDLRRAKRESLSFNYPLNSTKGYILEPTIEQVREILHTWHILFDEWSVDIETAKAQIECVGIAISKTQAICIPFMDPRKPNWCYWSFEEELEIRALLKFYLTHPRRKIIGQNFSYDQQYFIVRQGFWPRVYWDTMIMSHVLYCELPKSLDYLARLWAEHYVYWKDDGKIVDFSQPPKQRWEYNCRDCCYTWEIYPILAEQLRQQNLLDVYRYRVDRILPEAVKAMLRGIRVDAQEQQAFGAKIDADLERYRSELRHVLGHDLNVDSNPQMKKLFIEDFKIQPILDRKSGNPTFDDEALVDLGKKYPLLRPLLRRIQNIRTARTLKSNYGPGHLPPKKKKWVGMRLDEDSRARTSYNLAGPVTFRFASSANVFGSGRNLQNIPRDEDEFEWWQYQPPSTKHMFQADPGYLLCEADLERADLVVVVEEMNDDNLRQLVRGGADIHTWHAQQLMGRQEISDTLRTKLKELVHGTHYGGKAWGIAGRIGLTVAECEHFQRRYHSMRPGLKPWHLRTDQELQTSRRVSNCFGHRRIFFDRIEGKLGEALAFKPQSVVGEVINRAWVQLGERLPEVQVLLQVHDSLVFQVRVDDFLRLRPLIREAMRVVVPYPKPFEIGVGLSISPCSWGDAKKKWEWKGQKFNGWNVPLELALGRQMPA